MKQLSLIPEIQASKRKEHGGSLLLGRRRKRRPLSLSAPLHLVLRSDFAVGSRSLLRHRPLIEKVISKAQRRFRIRVYEKAIVSNHIHLLVKGYRREDIQNFFRVVAGHIAQSILREFPIRKAELATNTGGAPSWAASREKVSSPGAAAGAGANPGIQNQTPDAGAAPTKPAGGRKNSRSGATPAAEGKNRPLREKDNKFWQTRIYSRVMSWGREYRAVKKLGRVSAGLEMPNPRGRILRRRDRSFAVAFAHLRV